MHRRLRRERMSWGGWAWTLPIPTKPRIHGDFTYFAPYEWALCDIVSGKRAGRFFSVGGLVVTLRVRTHGDPTWAEAETIFGFDPGMPA